MAEPIPYFDGHNDVLFRIFRSPETGIAEFLEGTEKGHLDLPRARQGHFVGGLFALFSPSPRPAAFTAPTAGAMNLQLPPPLPAADAWASASAEAALLFRLIDASKGQLTLCRTVADIRAAMGRGSLAVVLHLEGADCIDPDFYTLDLLYAAGLRSLGPVWSRPTIYGEGVPMTFPGSPDIGGGLTDAGKALVKGCNERRIMLDLSHLNEAGFWDVAALSTAPLVATHSNAHALCPCSRNLTDKQLAAIRETGGVVGLNLAVSFLRADGRNDADTPVETLVAHVDHLVERLGIDGVALGTDFDGCTVPACIKDAAGLPVLIEALRARGYDEAALRKFAHENWLGVLERTWGE
jgi:membrane dipeptidase